MADLSVIAVTLLFLLSLRRLHHQLLTRDTRLAYHVRVSCHVTFFLRPRFILAIRFGCASKPPLEVTSIQFALDANQNNAHSCEHNDAHSMRIHASM